MEVNFYTNISFCAIPGKNLLKSVEREFNGEQTKVKKFIGLFNITYADTVEKNTVIDIDKNKNYVLYNLNFPKVKHKPRAHLADGKSIAEAMITECPKVFGWGEQLLFQDVVRKSIKNGIPLEELEITVKQKFHEQKSQQQFLDIIKCAKRIQKENPKSKFTDIEFEIMDNKIGQEEINTPGTPLYELAHSILKLSWKHSNG